MRWMKEIFHALRWIVKGLRSFFVHFGWEKLTHIMSFFIINYAEWLIRLMKAFKSLFNQILSEFLNI